MKQVQIIGQASMIVSGLLAIAVGLATRAAMMKHKWNWKTLVAVGAVMLAFGAVRLFATMK